MSKTKLNLNRGDEVGYHGYQVEIIEIFEDNSVVIEYLDGECQGEQEWIDSDEALSELVPY